MQTVLSFVLSRKIINIYNNLAQKYGNVTAKDLENGFEEHFAAEIMIPALVGHLSHYLSHYNTFCITLSPSSIIFIISVLIIGIFHCLNYTSLLLHLIIRHLVSIFCNNYVINICPRHLFQAHKPKAIIMIYIHITNFVVIS